MTDDDRPPDRLVILQAKNVSHLPDITSDEYWDTHDIALVRVEPEAETGRPAVAHRVLRRISEGPIEATPPAGLARPTAEGTEIPSAPRAGGEFVVFYARHPSGTTATVPMDGSPAQVSFVNRLNRIARLRSGEGGPDALRQATFDPDRDVAVYSLKRLLKQEDVALDRTFVGRLRGLADAPEADPHIRLLAEQVVLRGTRGAGPAQEIAWIESALSDARGPDWTRLRVLALRMLDFPDQRERTARFLTSLVKDPTKSLEARIAAYSVFEDDRLFPRDRTDDVSNLVFEAVEQMAQSPEEVMHQAGVMLLQSLSTRLTGTDRPSYVERARTVLQSTLARKGSPASGHLIQRSLDLLRPPEERR